MERGPRGTLSTGPTGEMRPSPHPMQAISDGVGGPSLCSLLALSSPRMGDCGFSPSRNAAQAPMRPPDASPARSRRVSHGWRPRRRRSRLKPRLDGRCAEPLKRRGTFHQSGSPHQIRSKRRPDAGIAANRLRGAIVPSCCPRPGRPGWWFSTYSALPILEPEIPKGPQPELGDLWHAVCNPTILIRAMDASPKV